MEINLQESAITSADIEAERNSSNQAVMRAEREYEWLNRRMSTLLALRFIIILAALGVAAGVCIGTASVTATTATTAFITTTAASVICAIVVIGATVVATVVFASNTAVSVAESKLSEKALEVQELQEQCVLLGDAPTSVCPEIEAWLKQHSVLRTYRNSVVSIGRVFIMTEVEAMRTWVKTQEERERQEEIEASCRRIYFSDI